MSLGLLPSSATREEVIRLPKLATEGEPPTRLRRLHSSVTSRSSFFINHFWATMTWKTSNSLICKRIHLWICDVLVSWVQILHLQKADTDKKVLGALETLQYTVWLLVSDLLRQLQWLSRKSHLAIFHRSAVPFHFLSTIEATHSSKKLPFCTCSTLGQI